MKKLLFAFVFLVSCSLTHGQNNLPQLLLDGLPSGSVYTDSLGVLTVSGAPEYDILSIAITVNNNTANTVLMSGRNMTSIAPLLHAIVPGSKVTILAHVGCKECIHMKLTSHYYTPK